MRLSVGFLYGVLFACWITGSGSTWASETCAAVSAAEKLRAEPAENHPALRIYDLRQGSPAAKLTSYQVLLDELSSADVVFLGEQHDDPATHYMEWRILRDLAARHHGNQALSLEMFERDVQQLLNAYLRGELSEDEFLTGSRPWPNYPSDYRPLVELAKAAGLPVVAANIPRPLAARVAKQGLEPAQAEATVQEWFWMAAEAHAPLDLYWELFYATMGAMMGGHGGGESSQAAPAMPPSGMGGKPAVEAPAPNFLSEEAFHEPYAPGTAAFNLHSSFGPVWPTLPPGLPAGQEVVCQIYQAQCIKDDTMAESIARQRQRDPLRPVMHVNGCFHSDYQAGAFSRLQALRPQDKIISVTFRPALPLSQGDPLSEDLDSAMFSKQPRVADFLVFVPAPQPELDPVLEPAAVEEEPAEATTPATQLPAGV